jgi:hypothetical protein
MVQASLEENGINQKLLLGVQGDGFLEKSPPGRRRLFYKEKENEKEHFDFISNFNNRVIRKLQRQQTK